MKPQIHAAESVAEAQRKRIRLMTAVCLGALAGVLVGILAMAVGVLAISLLELFMDTTVLRLPGLSMTAVTFVVFFFLGALATTPFFLRKLKK